MADTPPHGPAYAELYALTNFSFQRGASHPEEMVQQAHALGYRALAITDGCSLAGLVRAHAEARRWGMRLLIGCELRLCCDHLTAGGLTLLLLATNRAGYAQISQCISAWRQAAAPPSPRTPDELPCHARVSDELPHMPDVLAIAVPWRHTMAQTPEATWRAELHWHATWLKQHFPQRGWIGVQMPGQLCDRYWLTALEDVSAREAVPLVACTGALMHQKSRKPLQDVLTALRVHRPLAAAGFALEPNAESFLHGVHTLAERYPRALLDETIHIAERCRFSLDELRYEYPECLTPAGCPPSDHLRTLTLAGAARRYPDGIPDTVRQQIDHELAIIAELAYEKYFLTVYDIVRFAQQQGILCQGRGSAANSAVCYCLGITAVDPARSAVLFERFISRERQEPPDIDVDFEHERREEVIQYLYRQYGRDRAALAAAVVRYQPRSALRDVGKALGVAAEHIDALAKQQRWWEGPEAWPQQLADAGLDPTLPAHQWLLRLAGTLIGFPRHLSQHTGGFVLTGEPLTQTVPVIPAAMPGRTQIEWDKDDMDALGLLKVDVLALGMLSAIRRALSLISERRGQPFGLGDIPAEDPATYDMICRADTIGVFQIESRAQMSMLPRLRPRCFYDLVIEVAIVRPGPIQGGMVHPYLQARERQRQGEPLQLPSETLRPALARTLGVPIFQEQVMQIAILAAGFTPGEADGLRRSMAAWRRKGGIHHFHQRVIDGMTARGYTQAFAEAIFRQIEGFGEYGFPESHAASFALLVYASAWLKRHEPACFLTALLNAQPMGFYSPSQLVQDAQRHGVEVLPVDVLHSDWDCRLEGNAVRLGLRLVAGLSFEGAQRITAIRAGTGSAGVDHADALARRAQLSRADLEALAAADALRSLHGHRRQQAWVSSGWVKPPPLLAESVVQEAPQALPAPDEGEDVIDDYASTGLTLRRHPLALIRPRLEAMRLQTAAQLGQQPHGRLVRACGLVTHRQRPGTAHGVMFLTLEDETGVVQVIAWRSLQARAGTTLLGSRLLAVHGQWQRVDGVSHLVAGHLRDLSPLLDGLSVVSRDFR